MKKPIKPIEVPDELAHLIEKRDQGDRRRSDRSKDANGAGGADRPAGAGEFKERRRGDRRKPEA